MARTKYHLIPEYVKISLGFPSNVRPLQNEELITISEFLLWIDCASASAISISSVVAAADTAGGDSLIIFMLHEHDTTQKANDLPAVKVLVLVIEMNDNDETISGNTFIAINTDIKMENDTVKKYTDDDNYDGPFDLFANQTAE